MRRIAAFVVVVAGLFGACSAVIAQEAARPGAGVSGKWLVTADFNGTPLFFRMELKEEAGKLTGEFGGDKLTGTLDDKAIHFVAKDDQGGTEECTATLKDGAISGTFIFTDADDRQHPETHTFTATLAPLRKPGAPQRHDFTPTSFYRQFSQANKPVLTVGETDAFMRAGGVIRFYLDDGRVRFEINPDAAARAGVKVSSKLLNLARIYKQQ